MIFHLLAQIIAEIFGRLIELSYLCIVLQNLYMETVRKVIEVTDTPIETIGGRKLIRRVEKVQMPSGRYRYPVTYIDKTPGFRVISREEWMASRIKSHPVIKLSL